MAKGGGDDADDVAGGLNDGYYMSWRSNARYAILLADAPGHGILYHNDFYFVKDDFPEGDPEALVLEDIMMNYVKKNINLCLIKINDNTDKMYEMMIFSYNQESQKSKEKPKIQQLIYEKEYQSYYNFKKNYKKKENQIDGKKFKSTINLGDLISKTAVEIYKLYSKKNY